MRGFKSFVLLHSRVSQIINHLWSHPFVRKAAHFFLLRVVAAVVTAFASAWAARCLGPENLGVSAFVVATVAQAALILGLFPDAVLIRTFKQSEKLRERQVLYNAVTQAKLIFASIVALVGVFIITCSVPQDYRMVSYIGIVILYTRSLSPGWVYQALEQMRSLAVLELLIPTGIMIGYLVSMRPGASAGHDLTIQAIVAGFVLIFMLLKMRRLAGWAGGFSGIINWRKIRELLWASRWLAVMQITIYFYTNFDMALLGYLTDLETVGRYRTALSWSQALMILVTLPSVLLFPRFVEWRKVSPEYLWRRQVKLGCFAFIIALFGVGSAIVIIPLVHPIWFGSIYGSASTSAILLVSSKLMVLVNGVFAWGVISGRQNDAKMAFGMGGVAIVSVISNIIAIPHYGMEGVAAVNLISEILILFLMIYFSWPKCILSVN